MSETPPLVDHTHEHNDATTALAQISGIQDRQSAYERADEAKESFVRSKSRAEGDGFLF